jgi:3D (Asp-Asp-Asp) domain-containing protein
MLWRPDMMSPLSLLLALIISLCSIEFAHAATVANVKDFSIAAPPTSSYSKAHTLWATYYYTPTYNTRDKGYPLLDMQGDQLGPVLSHREWCMAALEGSVAVKENGVLNVYNFAGFNDELQVDCTKYFKYKKSGRIRFRTANGPYGDGAGGTSYILFPYRTIAVDNSQIPYGTLIYIPAARGIKVDLKSGKSFTHDGYFFAADKGGAIKGNHIDVFQGVQYISGFNKFIKSKASGTFKAYTIRNEKIRKLIENAHYKDSGVVVPGEF